MQFLLWRFFCFFWWSFTGVYWYSFFGIILLLLASSFIFKVFYYILRFIIIIIYHNFLPPPRRGCHVKLDTHTIINIHSLPHILDTCTLIFNWPFFIVNPNHICNSFPPLSRWQPPEYGRVVQTNTGPCKRAVCNSFNYIYTRALHSFCLSCIVALLLQIFWLNNYIWCMNETFHITLWCT